MQNLDVQDYREMKTTLAFLQPYLLALTLGTRHCRDTMFCTLNTIVAKVLHPPQNIHPSRIKFHPLYL